MAEEIRANEPTDAAEWAAIERRRKRAIALVVAVAVVALAVAGVAVALLAGRKPPVVTPTIEPIEETSASVQATSGVVATSSVAATKSADATAAVTPGASAGTVPKPAVCLVAYRRDGWICVAKPDGSGETRLLETAAGVFSLSPDAKTLAVVSANTLSLVDVASRRAIPVGSAMQDQPSWSPDSAWLVYVRDRSAGPQVRRVQRDGSHDVALFDGMGPSVSPAGDVIVAHAGSGPAAWLAVWQDGSARRVDIAEQVVDVVTDGRYLYVARAHARPISSTVERMDLKGRGAVVLRDSASAGRPVSYFDLCVSADGSHLSFAEHGDDGYSRMFSMATATRSVTALSIRRDDYPLCWGCDGRLYFIEGNAVQGEATKLMAVMPDGLGRVTLVEGATR